MTQFVVLKAQNKRISVKKLYNLQKCILFFALTLQNRLSETYSRLNFFHGFTIIGIT